LFVKQIPQQSRARQRAVLRKTQKIAARKESRTNMEYFFTCPYCWEEISMVLDLSVTTQIYVEDCEVCCNPIEVRYLVEDGAIVDFSAQVLE
jgi:transcription elongation factor Elf1